MSAAAYRLALSLAFWWHEPGKMRVPIPKGRGRPGKLWLRSPETGPPTGSGAVYVDHRQLGNVGDAPVRVVVDVHPSRAAVAEPVAG